MTRKPILVFVMALLTLPAGVACNNAAAFQSPPQAVFWTTTGNAGTTQPAGFLGTTDIQPLVIKTNAAERMRILSGGNVGIGTTAPSEKLDVGGSVRATAFKAGVGSTTYGDGSITLSGPTNSLNIDAGTLFVDAANNNVGIGTTAPEKQLHIVATQFETAPGSRGIRVSSGGLDVNLVADGVEGFVGTTSKHDFRIVTSNTVRTTVTAEGNVGIGTTTPTQKLDVSGNVHASGSFTAGAGTTYGDGTITLSGLTTVLNVNGGDFRVDGTTFLVDESENRVGIGETLPQAKLHVSGAMIADHSTTGTLKGLLVAETTVGQGNVGIEYENDTGATGSPSARFRFQPKNNNDSGTAISANIIARKNSGNDGASIAFETRDDEAGAVGTPERMRIDHDGNVGIGTASPGAKLHVAGIIRVDTLGSAGATAVCSNASHEVSTCAVSSDARLKTDVKPLTGALEKLEQIRGVSFEWNNSAKSLGLTEKGRHIGVIAQDVEAVFPELVSTRGDQGYKAVEYDKLTAVLVAAVKELHAENQKLRARLEAVEKARGVTPAQPRVSGLSNHWLLSGGLVLGGLLLVIPGLVLGYRRFTRSNSRSRINSLSVSSPRFAKKSRNQAAAFKWEMGN